MAGKEEETQKEENGERDPVHWEQGRVLPAPSGSLGTDSAHFGICFSSNAAPAYFPTMLTFKIPENFGMGSHLINLFQHCFMSLPLLTTKHHAWPHWIRSSDRPGIFYVQLVPSLIRSNFYPETIGAGDSAYLQCGPGLCLHKGLFSPLPTFFKEHSSLGRRLSSLQKLEHKNFQILMQTWQLRHPLYSKC